MWIFFILFHFFTPIFSSFPAKITGCTASTNQNGYHCTESIDGLYVVGWVDASNGWAFNGILPSNVEYDMEKSFMINQIRILTGIERPNHMITNFQLEVIIQTFVKFYFDHFGRETDLKDYLMDNMIGCLNSLLSIKTLTQTYGPQ